MAPFDRPYTTFHWSAIVNIALSGTVFELFDVTLKCGLEVTQGYRNWYHLKAWCGFLFAFRSNYGSLHQFRDKARYWSKIVIFFISPCIRRNIDIPFGMGKLDWWGHPIVKKTLKISITV